MGVLETLSRGLPRPSQEHLKFEEDRIGPRRRRQRQIRGNDGEPIVVELESQFSPTSLMNDVREDIVKARMRVVRAYARLSGNGMPDFKGLEKLRECVRKVTRLEVQYGKLELLARKAHEAKREEMSRKVGEHSEGASRRERARTARLEWVSKQPRREQPGNRWLEQVKAIRVARVAARGLGIEGAKDALAEGEITIEEYRLLKSRFEKEARKPAKKKYREPTFKVRHSAAPKKKEEEKKKKGGKKRGGGNRS